MEKRFQVILENEVSDNLNPNDKLRACLNELLKVINNNGEILFLFLFKFNYYFRKMRV